MPTKTKTRSRDLPPSRWPFAFVLIAMALMATAYDEWCAPDPSQEHQGP